MLIGYILLGMFVICTLFSAASGASPAAGGSVMEGAQEAVSFCVSVAGGVCLWSAVLELMERCGVSAALSRALRPLLRGLFPRAAEDAEILAALSENVGANLLGLGNAATPAGIRAAKGLRRLSGQDTASDELCRLVVLNTASIQLLPTTVAALRASLGADAPFDILPAVWLSSLVSVAAGLLAARAFERAAL